MTARASKLVFCSEDARRVARRRLPRMVFDYVEGAAGRELGAARNLSALDQIELQPRVMERVAKRSLKTSFLGHDYAWPFGIAPMGMCNLVRPGTDRLFADAARRYDFPTCLSTAGTSSLEDMRGWAAEQAWFQLYVTGSEESAFSLVDRAASAGYETLLLTVDVPQLSRRVRDIRNGLKIPFRPGPRQIWDLVTHPAWSLRTAMAGAPKLRNFEGGRNPENYNREQTRDGANWSFLDRLRARWRGKLVVKGVMSAAEAVRIRDAGADAVYVSNHGARQLDATPAAISVLPKVRAAVGPDYPLIFDSGLRGGEDIAKALALGADFVMFGRPMLWAVGADGEAGLHALLKSLAEELDIALAQLGVTSPDRLSPDVLVNGDGAVDATAEPPSLVLASA